MGSQRVIHDWSNLACMQRGNEGHTRYPWISVPLTSSQPRDPHPCSPGQSLHPQVPDGSHSAWVRVEVGVGREESPAISGPLYFTQSKFLKKLSINIFNLNHIFNWLLISTKRKKLVPRPQKKAVNHSQYCIYTKSMMNYFNTTN